MDKFQKGDWDWPLQNEDGVVHVLNTADKFEVGLEAKDFIAKDCHATMVGDYIEVTMEHEMKGKRMSGEVAGRAINRTYRLPPDVDKKSLRTEFHPEDCIFMIHCDKKH